MKSKIIFLSVGILIGINAIIKAQIPSYVPSANLVGWWPFNNNANDESGGGKNGTLLNGVIAAADRFGNASSAYSFDGIDDRIFINNAFFNNGWSQYTFSCWVNLTTVSNMDNVNSSNFVLNTSPHNGICFGANWGGSGNYSLFAGNGSWNGVYNGQSTQSATAGSWMFLTLTKNANSYKLYVNGVFDKTWTSAVAISSTYYKIYFGGTDPITGANEVLNGKLDDIGIWDRELTVAEITSVYQSNTIGIKENAFETNFCSIYPNPANQNLILDIDNYFIQKLGNEISLNIYSRDGKLVKSDKVDRNEIQNNNNLDIENLLNGLYLLKISSGNYSQNIKFIKE